MGAIRSGVASSPDRDAAGLSPLAAPSAKVIDRRQEEHGHDDQRRASHGEPGPAQGAPRPPAAKSREPAGRRGCLTSVIARQPSISTPSQRTWEGRRLRSPTLSLVAKIHGEL